MSIPDNSKDITPFDLSLEDLFGNVPRTVIIDKTVEERFGNPELVPDNLYEYLKNVLQMESVACKDYLTNKVDRSVTGKVALQQCAGEIQLPLNDCGVVALDYRGTVGIATSIGHAPLAAMINPEFGSQLSIVEALTNIVWIPLKNGLRSVSLSANWMWASKNEGEDARLYRAVQACSQFACELGVNIPTGKDSLSMRQNYPDGKKVFAPGTVIISSAAEVEDVKKIVSPPIVNDCDTVLYYIDFTSDKLKLGGSVLFQTLDKIGDDCPQIVNSKYFINVFETIQQLIRNDLILAGHDISAGGLITTLVEMCFANQHGGLSIDLEYFKEKELLKILFAENPSVVIQVKNCKEVDKIFKINKIHYTKIGKPIAERRIDIKRKKEQFSFSINELRDIWYEKSYFFDRKQSGEICARYRFENYKKQPLAFEFSHFDRSEINILSKNQLINNKKPIAAILRDKGTNGEREMAYSLYLAGFDVKDVHLSDLICGRETLENVNFIVFCGGFSNSDVFGSAKGWAGGILFNEKAKTAIEKFYSRSDTLSLGVCNGCQLMMHLAAFEQNTSFYNLFGKSQMLHNDSQKFESAFISVEIPQNNSVMFNSLSNSKLGIWIAHGEGKFHLPEKESNYNIVLKYAYSDYPGNPNGSDYDVAGICSPDGRHLAMMPHLERAIFPWQWAYYPLENKRKDKVTAWFQAFVNAKKWIENH